MDFWTGGHRVPPATGEDILRAIQEMWDKIATADEHVAKWPSACPVCGCPVTVGEPCSSGMARLETSAHDNPHAPRPDICREVGHCERNGTCQRCGVPMLEADHG